MNQIHAQHEFLFPILEFDLVDLVLVLGILADSSKTPTL
jgi:hypothetical protein